MNGISSRTVDDVKMRCRHALTKLTLRSRVLPEKLTVLLSVKKLPAVYVTRRFIAAFTCGLYLSLS
jgi:hypothetical protein